MNSLIQNDETLRYFPCSLQHGYFEPLNRKVNFMLHLVAYDIANPRRLRRVARTCEDYGMRVEYSIFECDLPPDRFELLWEELIHIIQPLEDALVAYAICSECLKKARTAGIARRPEKSAIFIL